MYKFCYGANEHVRNEGILVARHLAAGTLDYFCIGSERQLSTKLKTIIMTEQEAKKATKPAVVKKKPSKPKVPADHPTYNEMIRAAIVTLADRSGSSRQAIQKYILANYKVGDPQKSRVRVRVGLKRMEASGLLKHTKGKGASGSFRLGDKAKVVKPKAAAAKKKPAAKKPAAKKATKKKSPKKAAVKKSAAKKPAKKSPVKKSKPEKKASKPKKAKSPAKKKTKSKSPSKKKTTKKAAKK
ncbi:uncharacterized protein [Antedon mediterranea]|uniref:uncharacterized protein n=1 Tax=Antedon mediterranea TaxID=105859 RepID=UPI003AF95AB2